MVDPISIAAGLGSIMSSVGGAVASGASALGTAGGLTAAGSLAGAGLAGYSALEAGKNKVPGLTPAAPPVQSPVGSQTSNAQSSTGPSFLAAAATPQTNNLAGRASLLGG